MRSLGPMVEPAPHLPVVTAVRALQFGTAGLNRSVTTVSGSRCRFIDFLKKSLAALRCMILVMMLSSTFPS